MGKAKTFLYRLNEHTPYCIVETMPKTDSQGSNSGTSYTRLLGLGFTFITILGVFVVAGFFVDRLLGTLPIFLLLGVGIGFVAGLYYVYRALGTLGGG